MKKLIMALLVMFLLIGCAQMRLTGANIKTNTLGRTRQITLYDYQGKTIRQWYSTAPVDNEGSSLQIIDMKGNVVILSGIYTVEEVK
jgi:hypothetical protein